MSEEGATYVDPKLIKLKKRKDINHPAQKMKAFPWHIVAICLGILLLLATTGLGYMFFQCSSGCKMEEKKHRCENNASLPAAEDHLVVPPSREKICDGCCGKWSCCGKNCYYFSKQVKTWNESKKSCEGRASTLIKIDDEEEQRFIQRKIKYASWIGLYKEEANDTWKWLDDSKISTIVDFLPSTPDAKCGLIKLTNIAPAVCTLEFHYICEKKLDLLDN